MQEQGLERSKGEFSSKRYAACDALGNQVIFFVTASQRSDYIKALDMIQDREIYALIGLYDADYMLQSC